MNSPSPQNENSELMKAKEVADYLRIPLATVYYLVQRGQLPAVQIGKRWRIKRSLIDKNILQTEAETEGPAEEIVAKGVIQVQETAVKQVTMITAGKEKITPGIRLLEEMLCENKKTLKLSDDIKTSDIIILDTQELTPDEIEANPLDARVVQNFPSKAHVVLVGKAAEVQKNLAERRGANTQITLLPINGDESPEALREKVQKVVRSIANMQIAA